MTPFMEWNTVHGINVGYIKKIYPNFIQMLARGQYNLIIYRYSVSNM